MKNVCCLHFLKIIQHQQKNIKQFISFLMGKIWCTSLMHSDKAGSSFVFARLCKISNNWPTLKHLEWKTKKALGYRSSLGGRDKQIVCLGY